MIVLPVIMYGLQLLLLVLYYYELYKQSWILNRLRVNQPHFHVSDLFMTFANASLSQHNMFVFFLRVQ